MTEKAILRRIVIDPKIMLGKPVIRRTRLTVQIIVGKVAYGATLDDIKKDCPFILLRVDTPRLAASSSYRRTPLLRLSVPPIVDEVLAVGDAGVIS